MNNRLDKELVIRSLVESRAKAQELIKNGYVVVNDKVITKESLKISDKDKIEIIENDMLKYVSRGGLKLEKAITCFSIDMNGKMVMDIGSSTGGFTDCSLQHGAKKIYAIDVGTNVMVEKLRNDPRVELYEQTNFKDISFADFPKIDIITVDVSFISLSKIIKKVASEHIKVDMICLIKPQFECGVEIATKYKGVIHNKKIHEQILKNIIKTFNKQGFFLQKISNSPIRGGNGNVEYIAYFSNQRILKNSEINIPQLVHNAFLNK